MTNNNKRRTVPLYAGFVLLGAAGVTFASLLGVQQPSESQPLPGYEVRFTNSCHHPVNLAIAYIEPGGQIRPEGWWSFDPNQTSFLASNGQRIYHTASDLYYYAEITDPPHQGYSWQGDRQFTVNGRTLNMKNVALSINNNTASFSIMCGNLSDAPVTLSSTNGGPWGEWSDWALCPAGTKAFGFSTRVERPLGRDGDDTALNAVQLYCRGENTSSISEVLPHPGLWGDWQQPSYCNSGYLRGFRLNVEPHIDGDDTAANNVEFACTNGPNIRNTNPLPNDGFGRWGSMSMCPADYVIDGIKVKFERRLPPGGDDTALNDIAVRCVPPN